MRVPFALAGLAILLGLTASLGACASAPAATTNPISDEPRISGLAAVLQGIGVDVPARGKFIVVNIPSFELVALQDGKPVLRSRVIVGRPSTPTPELATGIWAVKFNPSWTPTPSMARVEGLRPVPPGPNNPLGRILFELDNDQLIFLHDTNDRALFERPRRAFSHGCIRVEQARALAAWVLDETEAGIEAEIGRRPTHRVPLRATIPVVLVYRTRFPDEQGRLTGSAEIYGRERGLAAAAATKSPARSCAGLI